MNRYCRHSILAVLLIAIPVIAKSKSADCIDRRSVVSRHTPVLRAADYSSPFTVGNGHFAFTADVTGLQTFPDDYYRNGIPLETLSGWCWHSFPNPSGFTLRDASRPLTVAGRTVEYPTQQDSPAGRWLRQNPHRLPLGRVGFVLKNADGTAASIGDVSEISQTLDLWTGILHSNFSMNEIPVIVTTSCDPEFDRIAVRIRSALLRAGRIAVAIEFPYTYDPETKNKPAMIWNAPDRHCTAVLRQRASEVLLHRTVDSTEYYVPIAWNGNGRFTEDAPHHFRIEPGSGSDEFQVTVSFHKTDPSVTPGTGAPEVVETENRSSESWNRYWMTGGMIDFEGSSDPRAFELERRIILSQYLLRVQSCDTMPPQESGLTHSSWYGKFHTEMTWWHTAQFAFWNHPEFLEDNLRWYISSLPAARALARFRGLRGARWPKMTGPDCSESPGNTPFIYWNQPHPISLAELLYRTGHEKRILEKYQSLVFETAECLASMARYDSAGGRYVLGPPLWHAQETYDPRTSWNPTFELAYWKYAIETAQAWRVRLGQGRNRQWDNVLKHLSPLPVHDGLYVGLESTPTTFSDPKNETDHPSMLMALGFLPGIGVDTNIMRQTLHRVVETWHWEQKIWGWDYPMIAMTAARLGEPDLAVDILLKDAPHNRYAVNGHCGQTTDLPVYLPANGALLSAVAMMVAGWDGAPPDVPGFPNDGCWKIQYENIQRLP